MMFSEFRMQEDVCLSVQLLGNLPINHPTSKKIPGIISSSYTNKTNLLDVDRWEKKGTFAT